MILYQIGEEIKTQPASRPTPPDFSKMNANEILAWIANHIREVYSYYGTDIRKIRVTVNGNPNPNEIMLTEIEVRVWFITNFVRVFGYPEKYINTLKSIYGSDVKINIMPASITPPKEFEGYSLIRVETLSVKDFIFENITRNYNVAIYSISGTVQPPQEDEKGKVNWKVITGILGSLAAITIFPVAILPEKKEE